MRRSWRLATGLGVFCLAMPAVAHIRPNTTRTRSYVPGCAESGMVEPAYARVRRRHRSGREVTPGPGNDDSPIPCGVSWGPNDIVQVKGASPVEASVETRRPW